MNVNKNSYEGINDNYIYKKLKEADEEMKKGTRYYSREEVFNSLDNIINGNSLKEEKSTLNNCDNKIYLKG